MDTIMTDDYQVSALGLVLAEDTSFEDWLEKGETLLQMRRTVDLFLGDLLIFGEKHFAEDMWQQLVTARNWDTCRKAKYVCERVPIERRIQGLHFSHYDCVANLEPEEQDELLALASRDDWTREELRDEVRRRHPELGRRGRALAHEDSQPSDASGQLPERQVGLVKAADLEKPKEPPDSGFRPVGGIEITPPERPVYEPREPAGSVSLLPPTSSGRPTDDAAVSLYSIARSSLGGKDFRNNILAVLDERTTLVRIATAASRAVELGAITPELESAVRAA